MAQRFREEFRLRCLSLNHPDFSSFATSKWMSAPLYLVYRWVLAIFITVSFLMSRAPKGKWYTPFFSGWGLATITIYFDLSAILCSFHFFYKSKNRRSRDVSMVTENNDDDIEMQGTQYREELPRGLIWGYKFMWGLFNFAAVNSVIVTITYWGFSYNYLDKQGGFGYANIVVHLLNSVLMILDASITPLPVRVLHVVYSNIYGLLYIIAALIYWLASKKKAKFYPFLDYNKPETVVITVFVCWLVIQPFFQMFFYGIYRLRVWLQAKRGSGEATVVAQSDQAEAHPDDES